MNKKSGANTKKIISHDNFMSLINSIDDEGYVIDEYANYKSGEKKSNENSKESRIAHSDAGLKFGPIRFGLKRQNKILEARLSVDTEFEKSTMNGLNQVLEKVRPIYEERVHHLERAAKILTQTTVINKNQLKALENQIKELKRENEDVKRELIKCQEEKKKEKKGRDTIKLDKDTQKILMDSAVQQTKHVDEEVEQMEKIIEASKKSIDNGIKQAMITIEEGERKAAMMMQEADTQAGEIQEIKESMEKRGQIPTTISNIPEAPPAPNFDKLQRVSILKKGREVDAITLTPRSASVADTVKAAIVKEKTDLFTQLRRAVEDRRTWIEPNGDNNNNNNGDGDEWETSSSSIRPSKANNIGTGRLVPRMTPRKNQQQKLPVTRINNLRFKEEKRRTIKPEYKNSSSSSPSPLSSSPARKTYYNPYSASSSTSLRHKHGGTVSSISGSDWLKGMTESIMSKTKAGGEEEEQTKKVRFSGEDYHDSVNMGIIKEQEKEESDIIEEEDYNELDPFALEEAIQKGSV